MAIVSEGQPREPAERHVRIAATGDVHCGREGDREHWTAAFEGLRGRVDLILLAGDLTTHGEPAQAEILADAARDVDVPVLAVLGNHDWHANRRDEVAAALMAGGIDVLEREHRVLEIAGAEVGVVGCKGFVGGFPGSHMPDFGEPSLRRVYAETTDEVEGLARALEEISSCDVRIALLHYAPTSATIEGEPPGIWAFLGSDRLAVPIAQHRPNIVFHGHGHMGTFKGAIGDVPVYNVAQPVIGKDFEIFDVG